MSSECLPFELTFIPRQDARIMSLDPESCIGYLASDAHPGLEQTNPVIKVDNQETSNGDTPPTFSPQNFYYGLTHQLPQMNPTFEDLLHCNF